MKEKELFSVEDEVAVHPERVKPARVRETLPRSTGREKKGSSGACYYASTAFEPGVGKGVSPEYRDLLRRERARYPVWQAPFWSVLSGVLGGLFAVPAIFLNGGASDIQFLVIVFLGPFAEETLKQSGAVFQLEKMRGSLRYAWQFFLSGVLGGAVFSVLENLTYRHVYLTELPADKLASVMTFRWIVCTAMHILTTLVSSMGLHRVWRESLEKERPCRLGDAFPWFVAATFIHGLYNFSMLLLEPFIFKG